MAFVEELDIFFEDFQDVVVYSSSTYKGILDQPDEVVADGVVLTTDYQLTAKTSDLGDLVYGANLTVNGAAYTIRSVRKIDDGALCIVSLTKT